MKVVAQNTLPLARAGTSAEAAALLRRIRYEIIPIKSSNDCIRSLPPASIVSVTCSPSRGISATQTLCETLLTLGHTPIPHLAARCVDGPSHTAALSHWVRACGLKEVFIVGGDAPQCESYTHALPFMTDFLSAKYNTPTPLLQPQVDVISFAAHPDSHPNISPRTLAQSLLAKQSLLDAHATRGCAVTQMCFDASRVKAWLSSSRAAGFKFPVILGVPGPAPLHKLLSVAARIGVGESLRFIARGGAGVAAAVAGVHPTGQYDAAGVLRQLCASNDAADFQGIHCFTFNAVADAVKWADETLRQNDVAAMNIARQS